MKFPNNYGNLTEMFCICGSQLLGDVDFTDLYFVSTKFYHLFFLPLFPSTTYIVEKSSVRGCCCNRTYKGREREASCKSIIWGYIQGWVRMSSIPLLVLSCIMLNNLFQQKSEADPSHESDAFVVAKIVLWIALPFAPFVFLQLLSLIYFGRRLEEVKRPLIVKTKRRELSVVIDKPPWKIIETKPIVDPTSITENYVPPEPAVPIFYCQKCGTRRQDGNFCGICGMRY